MEELNGGVATVMVNRGETIVRVTQGVAMFNAI
jgi:hypothetical protein